MSNVLLYLGLLGTATVAWLLVDGNLSFVLGGLLISFAYLLPFTIIPTITLAAASWMLRGLNTILFHASVTVLFCLPLVCTSEPQQLVLIAPVQVLYGLLIAKPRWIHPLDAAYLEDDHGDG